MTLLHSVGDKELNEVDVIEVVLPLKLKIVCLLHNLWPSNLQGLLDGLNSLEKRGIVEYNHAMVNLHLERSKSVGLQLKKIDVFSLAFDADQFIFDWAIGLSFDLSFG